jgi:anti-sigma regulatory factor (Ser/Thr protein kinase)
MPSPPTLQLYAPCRAEEIAPLRHVVSGFEKTSPRLAEDLAMVVSELVTNAIRHADPDCDTLTLRACYLPDHVKIEVTDQGTGIDGPDQASSEALETSGLGLRVVEQLSRAWGVDRSHGRVWAEVPKTPELVAT